MPLKLPHWNCPTRVRNHTVHSGEAYINGAMGCWETLWPEEKHNKLSVKLVDQTTRSDDTPRSSLQWVPADKRLHSQIRHGNKPCTVSAGVHPSLLSWQQTLHFDTFSRLKQKKNIKKWFESVMTSPFPLCSPFPLLMEMVSSWPVKQSKMSAEGPLVAIFYFHFFFPKECVM